MRRAWHGEISWATVAPGTSGPDLGLWNSDSCQLSTSALVLAVSAGVRVRRVRLGRFSTMGQSSGPADSPQMDCYITKRQLPGSEGQVCMPTSCSGETCKRYRNMNRQWCRLLGQDYGCRAQGRRSVCGCGSFPPSTEV